MTFDTKLEYNQQHFSALLSGGMPLTEMAFAVEIAVSHFLGRSVSRFECQRSKLDNGDCRLEFSAMKPSGPITVSKVMTIHSALNEGVLPRRISEAESFLKETEFVSSPMLGDGQHRHQGYTSRKSGNLTSTIIEAGGFSGTSTLALISFGLSDMFTGLFALGVNHIKWQGSGEKTQLYCKHNLSENALIAFLKSKQDYDLNRKIKTLA